MPSTFKATDAAGYERIMGRWSRLLAQPFLDFAGPLPGHRVLDVGCGTGSLTYAIADRRTDATLFGIDVSEPYVAFARDAARENRFGFQVGDATALPFDSGTFDAALSLLVLHFVPEHRAAAAEMMRVTRPGGTLAATVWAASGLVTMRMFWDTAAALDPDAARARAKYYAPPLTRRGALGRLFEETGAIDVVETDLLVWMAFESFEDYWTPFLAGQGPHGAYVAGLDEARREQLRAALSEAYGIGQPDGPRQFPAVALAVRARVP